MQNCCSFNMAEPKHATKTTKNLGKYCVAGDPNNESCKNNSTTPRISMHEFPKPGNQLRNLWIKFVRRHRIRAVLTYKLGGGGGGKCPPVPPCAPPPPPRNHILAPPRKSPFFLNLYQQNSEE